MALHYICTHCRQNPYFVVGLCLGITLSLVFSATMPEDCAITKNYLDINPGQKSLRTKTNDEFEPRINLAGKPLKAQKTPQLLIRPRYFSTELGIREKLFVGVLTSQSTVASHGIAFNRTVANLVDKVMFFTETSGPQKLNVSMPGVVVFTDTRQILKPFHMLKYITDNYLDEFDFFYLVKDTTYVKARDLYDFVRRISVSENVHVGSGKKDSHTVFCSLDAGILLSNSVMQKVVANLDWCVKNAFSESDSDNIGRCILHATEIKCQDSVQDLKFVSYQRKKNFYIEKTSEESSDDRSSFESALSVYPVSDPADYFRLHSYFCKVALNSAKLGVDTFRQSITNSSRGSLAPFVELSWPLGDHLGNVPNNRFDVLRWEHFTQTHIYLDSDFTNKVELTGSNLKDIQYILNASILRFSADYNCQLEYRRLVNGYRRFDPSRGMDYRLDLAFRDKATGREVYKRVEVCKPLGKVEVVPMPYVTENSRVNLLLPIFASDRSEAKIFLEKYQSLVMEKHDKTFLMLILLYEPDFPAKSNKNDIYLDIKTLALSLSEKYKKDGSKIAWVSIKLPQYLQSMKGPFLDFAIADLTVKKFNPDSLILMVRPNMELRQDYLNRVRMNTILNWQVFSPIPFSEFYPEIVYNDRIKGLKELEINKTYGNFDSKSTEHISFYAADYSNARRVIQDVMPVVKSERDLVSLAAGKGSKRADRWLSSVYAMFVRSSELHVLRAVEPGLRLRYTSVDCNDYVSSLTIYESCIEKRNLNLGARSQLAKLILDYTSQR